ncbi:hypothetical protein OXYTRIMIC_679 [Oxytricha trifallax]|uniref:Uncharacterized protein n=1 Tax=Oxytricha trifallax TaxID=1172189 RepID=A0A073HXK9_9SPIT|nr:hypothetical protein OXYTRIMIC_679 [Oxytricha trifallax]
MSQMDVNHHTFNMKYNKFIDEINMSYQLSTIIFYIHIQIGGILHQETSVIGSTRNSKKLIKDYKFISADYLLVQREQAIHIYEIDVPEPPIHQIPIDYNGPILYNLNFNIAQFAVGVVLTRDGYFQVADIMKSGYKNKYKHQVIQGLPLCQVSLGNGDDFENREKFSCIIKVKNGQLAVLLGSMQ